MSQSQKGQPGINPQSASPAETGGARIAALDGIAPELHGLLTFADTYNGETPLDSGATSELPMVRVGGNRVAEPSPGIIERGMAAAKGYLDSAKESISSIDLNPRKTRLAAVGAIAAFAAVGLAAGTGIFGGEDTAKASPNAPRIQGEDHGHALGGTVNNAVEKLDAQGEVQIRAELNDIFANPDKYDDLYVSHESNMQSRLKDYNEGNITKADVLEGVALSSLNDYGYRQSVANALEGKDPETPRSDSAEDQIAMIADAMTGNTTEFDFMKLNGTYDNHGQYNDVNVFGEVENFQGVSALVISADGYHKVIVKIGGGNDGTDSVCLNIETPEKTPPSSPPSTPATPPSPPSGGLPPSQPPSTPATPNTPYVPPATPEIPAKHDSNTTPAGVPGQNGGTPDNAGHGPAGQTPDSSGYLPTETKPATPAPKPTPEPLPTQPAPTAPAEVGQPTPAPAQPGTGTETPAPVTDPNPQS